MKSFVNFHHDASKHQKTLVLVYVAHFEEQKCFQLYLFCFTGLKKSCSIKLKPFLWIFPISNNNFLSNSRLLSEIVTFFNLKEKFFCQFPRNYFKTPEKLSLAV